MVLTEGVGILLVHRKDLVVKSTEDSIGSRIQNGCWCKCLVRYASVECGNPILIISPKKMNGSGAMACQSEFAGEVQLVRVRPL